MKIASGTKEARKHLWNFKNIFRSSSKPLGEKYVNKDAFLIARSSLTRNETMQWLLNRNAKVDTARYADALEGDSVGAQCGRYLFEQPYFFSEVIHSFNQCIEFDDWHDKMKRARNLALAYENFYLHYRQEANTETTRHFQIYVYTACMESVFGIQQQYDEDGELIPVEQSSRRRFISFIGHICYVGTGLEAEPFLKLIGKTFAKCPATTPYFQAAKKTGAYDVVLMSSSISEGKGLLFESDMIHVLEDLCTLINTQSYLLGQCSQRVFSLNSFNNQTDER